MLTHRVSVRLIIDRLDLMSHIRAVQQYFLMQAGDVMDTFARRLFEHVRLQKHTVWGATTLARGDTAPLSILATSLAVSCQPSSVGVALGPRHDLHFIIFVGRC